MDTRMIEVALGLALVFGLSSLLVTAMRELWASAWGSRGKVLQQAMTSFLGDDHAFAGNLMKHPLLVSLTRETTGGTPSYMGADIVITSLIGLLVDRCTGGQRPASPAQFVEAVRVASQGATASSNASNASGSTANLQARMALPNGKLVEGMQSLIHGVENDWPGYQARLCAWYDSVTERSIGWFKRKNQITLLIFGFALAAAANINPIVIAPRLWQDAPMRQALASAAEKAGDAYANAQANGTEGTTNQAGTAAPALVARPQASFALDKARADYNANVVETERRLHALKAKLEAALDAPGTPPSSTALQGLHQGYQQVLGLRRALDDARLPGDGSSAALRRQLEADGQIEKAVVSLGALAATAGSAPYALQPLQAALDKALTAERQGQTALLTLAGAAPTSDECTHVAGASLCQRLDELNSLKALGLPIGWDPFLQPQIFKTRCVKAAQDATAEPCWDLASAGNLALVLVGWFVTAVAASLGAPFWFDLLNKVAKLRASGARPSAADEAGTALTPPGGTVMSQPLDTPSPNSGGGSGGSAVGAPAAAGAAGSEPMSDALNTDEKRLGTSEVRRLQSALGLAAAQISGAFDGVTRQAIKTWQQQNNYGASAELTARQIDELLDARRPASVSAEAPATAPATAQPLAAARAMPSPLAMATPSNAFTPPVTLLRAIADGGPPVPWDALGSQKGLAREVQNRLAQIGLLDPPADGAFGPVSLWALSAFLKAMNAPDDRQIDGTLARLLLSDDAMKRFPFAPGNDLAGRIATAMTEKKYWLCRHPDAVNIVYVEGMNADGTPNANTPNEFNDLRTVLRFDANGAPWLAGCWQATTEPGRDYTLNPLPGTTAVARIALGQFKAWTVGMHKTTQPALVQVAPIDIYRDLNRNYHRDEGERVSIAGSINQHSGYDFPVNRVGVASAGCLVGRTKAGHAEFMALCEADPRYLANRGYRFMTTVLEAKDLPQPIPRI